MFPALKELQRFFCDNDIEEAWQGKVYPDMDYDGEMHFIRLFPNGTYQIEFFLLNAQYPEDTENGKDVSKEIRGTEYVVDNENKYIRLKPFEIKYEDGTVMECGIKELKLMHMTHENHCDEHEKFYADFNDEKIEIKTENGAFIIPFELLNPNGDIDRTDGEKGIDMGGIYLYIIPEDPACPEFICEAFFLFQSRNEYTWNYARQKNRIDTEVYNHRTKF